jgi:hypothetical protein
MDTKVLPTVRHVDRIATKVDHGPTAQSNSSSIIIASDNVRPINQKWDLTGIVIPWKL